jgi:hypothetical protein
VLGIYAKAGAIAPSLWRRDAEMLRRRGLQAKTLGSAGRVARIHSIKDLYWSG